MACLAGCINKFRCDPLNVPGQEDSILNAESASPFVIAEFIGGAFSVLVGNESAPNFGHNACITSLEYGVSDGFKATLEILDIQGGVLSGLLDNMIKCVDTASKEKFAVKFTFGWIYTTCDGFWHKLGGDFSFKASAANLEVNYTEGKIKYKIECADVMNVLYDVREDNTYGSDGKRMKLEDAITQLCKEKPSVNVDFCVKQPDGTNKCGGINWKTFGKGGPKNIWRGDSSNKLATITAWVESYQETQDRGIHVTWDNDQDRLIVWADWIKGECKSLSCSGGLQSLGTFLVNAGKCSNVIDFQPNFQWINAFGALAAGGETAGAMSAKTERKDDPNKKPSCQQGQGKKAGSQQQMTVSSDAQDSLGPGQAHGETNDSQNKHASANKIWGTLSPITAELRIVGNPDYNKYINMPVMPRSCSIVAINPFHLAGGSRCGDWLANPGCNEVLSNKNWMISGINHSIQNGTYETTLKLFLKTPFLDVDGGDPLGGAGSQGYAPRNTCT